MVATIAPPHRWTLAQLATLPEEEGCRYELIDGRLHVSKQPSWEHQGVCHNVSFVLEEWNRRERAGVVREAPGVIFADDVAVAPDVAWVRRERLPLLLGADRKLHGPPDLVVEVLSPGAQNITRDREEKLHLYSRQGVEEY